jgi:hypothetical protein
MAHIWDQVVAEEEFEVGRLEASEGLDAGRQPQADRVDHDLVVEVLFGVGLQALEMGEGVAQRSVG